MGGGGGGRGREEEGREFNCLLVLKSMAIVYTGMQLECANEHPLSTYLSSGILWDQTEECHWI